MPAGRARYVTGKLAWKISLRYVCLYMSGTQLIISSRRSSPLGAWRGWALAIVLCALALPAAAERALVAVAANFAETVELIAAQFEADTGHQLTITTGSTGTLYAQILHGAPFDALLAADSARPQRLEIEGYAVPGHRFTYAIGRLTLWSADPSRIASNGVATLAEGDFRALALANPALAPYGLAAKQALEKLDLWDQLRHRVVMGQSVAQTYAMVATGNAELGLVALSYVLSPRTKIAGSRWDLPTHLYEPIRQDAVLLTNNSAAREFLSFLRGAKAKAVLTQFGYDAEQ